MNEYNLKRAMDLAAYGSLSILVKADYAFNLPGFVKTLTKVPETKAQFLHMPPCRCGMLLSANYCCDCRPNVPQIYENRLRLAFYIHGYDIYLRLCTFDSEEFKKYVPTEKRMEVAEKMILDKELKDLLLLAKQRFGIVNTEKVEHLANVIASFEDKVKLEKVHLLEALSFYYR
ncbi:MAG: hypothetical protein PHE78_08560 [Candidatus Gastranaerophilales bacterium]|nr:hypothetical protein [Candidatus Gastranaerophilales bacterium]